MTLNHKVCNSSVSFSFCLWLCACMCVFPLLCSHQWRGVVLHKGQRSDTPQRMDGAKAASRTLLSVPPPSPCAVMGCLHGWWFPWQLAAFCTLRVRLGGLLKVVRGGGEGEVQSDFGWNSHMSYIDKANNFKSLFSTCLFFAPHPSY